MKSKRGLFYRKSDGTNLSLARWRKAKAKFALGWTIIGGMGLGLVALLATAANAPFLGVLAVAATIIAVTGVFMLGVKLVVEHG